MPKDQMEDLRARIDAACYADEATTLARLRTEAGLSEAERAEICARAATLVRDIRNSTRPGLMEVFLAEYGLSTDEGVALMCLAEALLRVPDAATIDALIEDKIAPSDWSRHMGQSTSPLVNASTWALMLTGKVLEDTPPGPVGHLRGAIKRLGEPVIRVAVGRAMREMGAQFVLGEDIGAAMSRARAMEGDGYTYSYDMLGEAARTEADARRYFQAYVDAIAAISARATHEDIRNNPGISVKLSALHPRYDALQADSAREALVPRLATLSRQASEAGIGLNVDAEEADRLSLSLDVIEEVLSDPALAGWDGFGVVVQAYGQRAGAVIDWLHACATRLDRRVMVRLVKGAYWDTEIKQAQINGLDGFPVFTSKSATDISYIANARKLLGLTDRIYPQFATHNAHTVSAILHMGKDRRAFEFQRLHGMGESLHALVKGAQGTRCRIYAPVGAHRDLLAYLVRRLLENGANSSFVNQIVDSDVPAEVVAADPFDAPAAAPLPTGADLFRPERPNSRGLDLRHAPSLAALDNEREVYRTHQWQAESRLAVSAPEGPTEAVMSPSDPAQIVGHVTWATAEAARLAAAAAQPWTAAPAERARVLNAAADLYEGARGEIFALLAREAGKTLPDALAELREAVDFLRYYAAQAQSGPDAPRGRFACISPWNFPLAIFTGQIAAALAAGNAVLAKPAEQTPLIAALAVGLMHRAGVPASVLQLLPGAGEVGAALTSCPEVDGIAFTGGTDTAQIIHRSMAEHLAPGAPLIAETGGLNAMIVDSTALPEQAVAAIVESAFQSAGQRCSALRCLYVQADMAETLLEMLKGAMDCLRLGDPWQAACDVGPVIDAEARDIITGYIDAARSENRVLHEGQAPSHGFFVPPTLIRVEGIAQMTREIFGPVLHVATFRASELDKVVADINATGFGLTFGLMTRIDDRVQHVTERVKAGNLYVNRNQIGAIVGSQPFGGEGLSGTGPKAGGPHYLERFRSHPGITSRPQVPQSVALPGPTGESNILHDAPRPPLLCLGPGETRAKAQAAAVTALGGSARLAPDLGPEALRDATGIAGALWWGEEAPGRAYRQALASRSGPILPLITGQPDIGHTRSERHICIDTTAAGGNAALLAGHSD